ncbi:centrosomal protein of 85 kDa isoform X2 [Lepisosteus oculatus]|uniref:centrosomal protein of 85 kDa isoform X2 n=4 Tax=Lepisosteus oculatus TaxID=7918 RepID=UPI0035F519CE
MVSFTKNKAFDVIQYLKVSVNQMSILQRSQDLVYQHPNLSAGCPDMEWQTPAVSEKFQSRFGRRPSTADSADTGLGTTPSDSTEDFRSSSGSPSFQPIRSQVTIPTAHVMPSTVGMSPSKLHTVGKHQACTQMNGADQDASSKSSPVSKQESPSPEMRTLVNGDSNAKSAPGDCLSHYRTVVNGLDHSLFPNSEHSRLDEYRKFDMPAIEPTLNQSALLSTFYADPRYRLQLSSQPDGTEAGKEGHCSVDTAYKALPESKAAGSASDLCGPRNGFLPSYSSAAPVGPHSATAPQAFPSQLWMREQVNAKGYDSRLLDRSCDLAAWQQQKQQLESVRLQMEQMQLLSSGSGQYSSLYPSVLHQEGNKWDAVIKANESLIKEKELVIERQKQQMSQLEQRLRESELQVHSALLGRTAPYSDVYLLRLQEAQRENTFLRAQFAERTDGLSRERAESERKLAAVEAELRKLNDTFHQMTQKHAEEMKKQEERVRSRDKHINSLKKKCQKESEQNREKQQRIETLERYLADLPTLEDYQRQSQQLKEVEERSSQLQDTVSDLEAKLAEARAAGRDRESQLEKQRQRELELLSTVHSLQEKVKESLEDGARLPSVDMEKLKSENSALKDELQRVKKVMEIQQKKMEQLGSQIRGLQEQVLQEEGTSQALREELAGKDKGLQQLRSAVKELSAQNQELMERNLTLQEKLGQPDRSAPAAPQSAQLAQRLHSEMAACLCDLQSLCNILTHRAQGRDPNLSLLLGITSTQMAADDQDDWQNPDVLSKKLSEVKQLRQDVEGLRTTILDRYAQDMGDNCITQ